MHHPAQAPVRSRRLLALLAALAAVFTIGSVSVSAATPLNGTFGGESYGTYANAAAGQLSSQFGRSAYLPCPCVGTDNQIRVLTAEDLNVGNDSGDVFHADAIRNSIQAGKAANGLTADLHHTSKVSGISALGGLITADAIKAAANTHADSTFITSNSAGSYFLNLTINGTPVADNVGPNQLQLALPGFGYVKLREVTQIGDGRFSGGISVNMLHIFVTTSNSLNIPVGVEIIVAHARTKFTRVTPAVAVGGAAWAADATSSAPLIVNKIGMIAPIYVPCQGTNGVTLSNNVNLTNFPGVITAGTALTKAYGSVGATAAFARTSAQIEDLNLLSSLVTADLVRAQSRSDFSTSSGGSTLGSSTYVGLAFGGVPYLGSLDPNTVVALPVLGITVTLNEQVRTVDSSMAKLKVTAIHIVVTDALLAGLPVGTEIRIAVARSLALAL